MISSDHFWLLALALILDAVVGDPDLIWRRVPHPAALIGALVGLLDRVLNRSATSPRTRRRLGALAVAAVVAVAGLSGYGLERLFAAIAYGWIGTVVVAATLLAGRSLYEHVAAVGAAFADGLDAARAAVGRIVGRDPRSLDEPRLCRAAIESAAENFSDGLVAPALWFALLGLPGLCVYKAINTADSMIGHLTPRHEDFGWAAARLDDLVNLPASRLSGALIALAAPLAGGSIAQSFWIMVEEAGHHRSPNAGWPEAAIAGALGIALGGPRRYAGIVVDDPFLNEGGRRDATPADIDRALSVYVGASAILVLIVLFAAGLALL
ncbi:MAG: adenosylcobinamide-phosphate synthase CbiB [Bauldia sp.]